MSAQTDFKTIVRPKSPNTYLLAPEGLSAAAVPDETSPEFNAAPDALFDAVNALVAEHGWSVISTDKTAHKLDAIAKTKLLKFKDDIAIAVLPVEGAPEKSKIAVYSRSRVGYSDLGANRKRVQQLVGTLKQRTGTTA